VRLEGLGQFKNPMTSGIQSRDLPACSVVPEPTTLPRAQAVRLLERALMLLQAAIISLDCSVQGITIISVHIDSGIPRKKTPKYSNYKEFCN
jgi:hypothetical protein